MKSRKEQLAAIDKTFYRLARCCESNRYWDQYVSLHQEEETGHRKFKPDFVQCGLTRAQAVRYFAVKEIFERYGMPAICRCGYTGALEVCPECTKFTQAQGIFTPTAKDFFGVRHSVFAAVAMVDQCGDRIAAEFTRPEMIDFLATVDYCALNKDQREVRAAA